ncbi:hypothetical protein ACT8ZV_10485 [Nocardioides sp. MAHUQ-72]
MTWLVLIVAAVLFLAVVWWQSGKSHRGVDDGLARSSREKSEGRIYPL